MTAGGVTDAAGASVPKRPTPRMTPWSLNQTLPSEPIAIPLGWAPALKDVEVNSVITPAGVMRPIAGTAPLSANQTFPSGPTARRPREIVGLSPAVNMVIVPAVVARPIPGCVVPTTNQRFPSGPTAIDAPGPFPAGRALLNSVTACVAGSNLPSAGIGPRSPNQMFPSGPATIPCCGTLPALRLYSVIACVAGSMTPIAGCAALASVNQILPS